MIQSVSPITKRAIPTRLGKSDLQPLGAALAGAMEAGDLPAMQAALRKISEKMPELAGDASAMSEVLAGQMVDALLGEESRDQNPDDSFRQGRLLRSR